MLSLGNGCCLTFVVPLAGHKPLGVAVRNLRTLVGVGTHAAVAVGNNLAVPALADHTLEAEPVDVAVDVAVDLVFVVDVVNTSGHRFRYASIGFIGGTIERASQISLVGSIEQVLLVQNLTRFLLRAGNILRTNKDKQKLLCHVTC